MNLHVQATLLGIGIPVCILFGGSVIVFSKGRNVTSLLQLIGAAGLMVIVLTHLAEAFQFLPWMGQSAASVITSTSLALFLAWHCSP